MARPATCFVLAAPRSPLMEFRVCYHRASLGLLGLLASSSLQFVPLSSNGVYQFGPTTELRICGYELL